jgi:hypothetical protein
MTTRDLLDCLVFLEVEAEDNLKRRTLDHYYFAQVSHWIYVLTVQVGNLLSRNPRKVEYKLEDFLLSLVSGAAAPAPATVEHPPCWVTPREYHERIRQQARAEGATDADFERARQEASLWAEASLAVNLGKPEGK